MPMVLAICLAALLHRVWAAPSSTSASPTQVPPPTKTSCPLHYITPVSPSPASYICNGQGGLSRPSRLGFYCNLAADGCYKVCARDSRCVTFSWDPINKVCSTYDKALIDMGFGPANKLEFFWNLRGCYQCSDAPTPPRSACNSPRTSKSPKPTDYTCGSHGYLQNTTAASYSLVYSDAPEAECYDYCLKLDAENSCVAFSIQDFSVTGSLLCSIYERSLREQGFVANSSSDLSAWNLRGCFECNAPPYKDTPCQPTTTPIDTGLLNGNFSETTFRADGSGPVPARWDSFYTSGNYIASKKLASGNSVVSLSLTNLAKAPHGSAGISQYAYLQKMAPPTASYFNLTFDLAIPQHYTDNSSTANGCRLAFAGGGEILANNKLYAGETLKPAGPFRVDYGSNYYSAYGMVYITLGSSAEFSDTSTAVVWIDNVRATDNGRDIGRI